MDCAAFLSCLGDSAGAAAEQGDLLAFVKVEEFPSLFGSDLSCDWDRFCGSRCMVGRSKESEVKYRPKLKPTLNSGKSFHEFSELGWMITNAGVGGAEKV